ncbi:hypothetical protein [Gimesia alba]|uniref:hypothetical protein n=1 Tax=Gimesia alba TaxID=2527973 RepID=UPI00119DD827|nr:hypothetical protein [Gimesia alba]
MRGRHRVGFVERWFTLAFTGGQVVFINSNASLQMEGTGANALRLISLSCWHSTQNKISRMALAAVNSDLGKVAALGITFKTNQ